VGYVLLGIFLGIVVAAPCALVWGYKAGVRPLRTPWQGGT
jgi:hypothetical protein